ncbi:Raftlin [Acipenser ruthenus]|uniref:Raftlin n=1 Tax=Acipenser ruthenus TaxID=7906 RepID=A0A662YN50_ACIRT|nr:Raftlin [Acipenser ruthenus]
MGCGLPKLEKPDENGPGKIYSTLKRPQVETKVGTAYSYCFLDFTLGKDAEISGSSAVKLSSLYELPVQLQELYQQGFVLAAVHPFVHPAGRKDQTPQEGLFRAVLIKQADSSEKNNQNGEPQSLEMNMCLSSDQLPGAELIQGFVKRVQAAGEQGVKFVGFIQQYGFPVNSNAHSSEAESSSLHCSLSTEKEESSQNVSPESRPGSVEASVCESNQVAGTETNCEQVESRSGDVEVNVAQQVTEKLSQTLSKENEGQIKTMNSAELAEVSKVEDKASETDSLAPTTNGPAEHSAEDSSEHIGVDQHSENSRDNGTPGNTEHTEHKGSKKELTPRSVEGTFIFEEASEMDSTAAQAYDAIVVEQWTTFQGAEVKTDYIPLLKSLAVFGWRLTCVLPTPIVKTNRYSNKGIYKLVCVTNSKADKSDKRIVNGSLYQMNYKKLSFKTRSKLNKNAIKDVTNRNQKTNTSNLKEKEQEDQNILEDMQKENEKEPEQEDRKNSVEKTSPNETETQATGNEKDKESATVKERDNETTAPEQNTESQYTESSGGNEGGSSDGCDASEEAVQETCGTDISHETSCDPQM